MAELYQQLFASRRGWGTIVSAIEQTLGPVSDNVYCYGILNCGGGVQEVVQDCIIIIINQVAYSQVPGQQPNRGHNEEDVC